jgi:imidazoleglycerol-phosphate dehydratase
MADTKTGVRMALATRGVANVATGVPVLDHLVGELARSGRFDVTLEVAPERADQAVSAAGRALGGAIAALFDDASSGRGWALVPSEEALATAALERSDRSMLASNVDFSDLRVGGLSTDVASQFLRELVDAAGLTLHVRLNEGTDPQHVLAAIFKAVGAALGQACRPEPWTDREVK